MRTQYKSQMQSLKRKHAEVTDGLESKIQSMQEEIDELYERVAILEKKLEEAAEELRQLREAKGRPLRYSNLYEGIAVWYHFQSCTPFIFASKFQESYHSK